MGSKQQAQKSSEYAKYMKAKGITRTTTNCPVGCGVRIGLGAVLSHRCPDGSAKRRRMSRSLI